MCLSWTRGDETNAHQMDEHMYIADVTQQSKCARWQYIQWCMDLKYYVNHGWDQWKCPFIVWKKEEGSSGVIDLLGILIFNEMSDSGSCVECFLSS